MNADRWHRIKELYHEARTLPEGEREAFLARACVDDDVLHHEIHRLFEQPVSTEVLLDRLGGAELALVISLTDETRPSLSIGERIGVYEVQALLDTGGMGEKLCRW
jgi:hypothetical protein